MIYLPFSQKGKSSKEQLSLEDFSSSAMYHQCLTVASLDGVVSESVPIVCI
jgi:hypothetical protein